MFRTRQSFINRSSKMNRRKLANLFAENMDTCGLFWDLLDELSDTKANRFMAAHLVEEFSISEINGMFADYVRDYFFTE